MNANVAPSRKPSALVLTPHYTPESGAAAQRLTAIAQSLASRGWRVTVITQLPHHPQNRVYDGFGVRAQLRRREADVDVIRLRPWLVSKTSLALRLLAESWFCIRVIPVALALRPDVVIASSPFMFLGPVGLLASRLRRARFVWDVRDLTWLYPRAAGKRTFGSDVLLENLMRRVARASDGLVTATNGLLNYFGDRPNMSMVLPNGVSSAWLADLTSLPPPEPAHRHVVYAGLLGFNHGLSTLIEAARQLPDVSFTIAGDGPQRKELQDIVAERGLGNVKFAGHLGTAALLRLYESASVLVSHVRAEPIHRWAQPAKLWEYMATGRPVVHAGEGEAADIVHEHGIAVAVPPEAPTELARAIATLFENWDHALDIGRRGQAYAIAHRDRSVLLNDLANFLDELELRASC